MQSKRISAAAGVVVVLLLAVLVSAKPAAAAIIDVYDGYDGGSFDFAPLQTYFTGFGNTVNRLAPTFTSLAGAQFVILSMPGGENSGTPLSLSPSQLAAIDAYVAGGGRLLLNSDGAEAYQLSVNAVNTILTSLGSSIVNQSTTSQTGYRDTTHILANAFTTGVLDVNYGYTSSLTGGTALVFGNSTTDNGQEFIAYQAIGAGYVFVSGDVDIADNINSTTTNNNGILYCNFAGLNCGSSGPVPEPSSLTLFLVAGTAMILKRKFASTPSSNS